MSITAVVGFYATGMLLYIVGLFDLATNNLGVIEKLDLTQDSVFYWVLGIGFLTIYFVGFYIFDYLNRVMYGDTNV